MAGLCYRDLGLEEQARDIWREGLSNMEQRAEFVADNRNMISLTLDCLALLGEKEKALEILQNIDEANRSMVFSPFLGKKEWAAARLKEFRKGNTADFWFDIVPHPMVDDLHTAPEYREMMAEYQRLRTRLKDTYGNIDLLNEYRAYELYDQGQVALQHEHSIYSINEALDSFRHATELKPDFVEAHIGLGGAYNIGVHFGWLEGASSLASARASFARALEISPSNMQAITGLIRVEFTVENAEACLRNAEMLRETGTRSTRSLLGRAWAYHMSGLSDLATSVLQEVHQRDPDNKEALYVDFLALAYIGHFERSIETAKKYLELFGDDPVAYLLNGVAYHGLARLEDARREYDRALDLFGTNTNFWVSIYAGRCYEDLGRIDEARGIWRTTVNAIHNRRGAGISGNLLNEFLAIHLVLLGEADQVDLDVLPRGFRGVALAAAYDLRGDRKAAARVLHALDSWMFISEHVTALLGFKNLYTAPEYEAPVRRLEEKEARLRDLYGQP